MRDKSLATPELHLQTLFVLNAAGRIVSTREPQARAGPLFFLSRGASGCAWAVRADVPDKEASELGSIARQEPPTKSLQDAPIHVARYAAVLAGWARSALEQSAGPSFIFPDTLTPANGVVTIKDERLLHPNFRGWVTGEIAAGCAPVLAVFNGEHPVSICFCARSSELAAEAGVDTADGFRGRGFAPRATVAWALAIRDSNRIPLYTTSWGNAASLAVARKLGLIAYASDWSLSE